MAEKHVRNGSNDVKLPYLKQCDNRRLVRMLAGFKELCPDLGCLLKVSGQT